MYFATYAQNNREAIGIINPETRRIIPVTWILGDNTGGTMLGFIENCNGEILNKIAAFIGDDGNWSQVSIDCDDLQLCAPIPQARRNIICLGLNYRDHAEELKDSLGKQAELSKAPVYFTKMASHIIGCTDYIDNHSGVTSEIDYEVELAVIIGKEGKNISITQAEDYIFGYSILNDLTARDLQKDHNQWMKGKSLDTFTAMGPWIVHKSKLPLPIKLNITCKVNDELRQNSNTKNLIFDIPYIISNLSKGMTLKPGDIIATGTPEGVGMGFKPPRYLKSGDRIVCSIDKIGELVNILK